MANQVVLVPAEPSFAYNNHITVKSKNFGAEYVYVSLKILQATDMIWTQKALNLKTGTVVNSQLLWSLLGDVL